MNIRNINATDKKAIISELQKIIRKHKFDKVKTVINSFFKKEGEKSKAQKQINELKKEIAKLEKKK